MSSDWPNYNTLALQFDEQILTVLLNRPDRLNAFTVEMMDELIDLFGRASEDDRVRAIIVTGSGRAFCAGMDLGTKGNVFGLDTSLRPTLADMEQRLAAPEIERGVRDTGGRVILAIYACKKPVIAAINGPAVGIGATMTLAMDVRIASDRARIGFVFGKLGIVPDGCSTWFLPRIVGLPRALEWFYSADLIELDEAREAGLLREIVTPDELMDRARALANKFSENRSPVSLALIRQMTYRNAAVTDPLEAHKIESLGMFYVSIGDGEEGVAAFQEKRPPRFASRASEMPPFYPWWDR